MIELAPASTGCSWLSGGACAATLRTHMPKIMVVSARMDPRTSNTTRKGFRFRTVRRCRLRDRARIGRDRVNSRNSGGTEKSRPPQARLRLLSELRLARGAVGSGLHPGLDLASRSPGLKLEQVHRGHLAGLQRAPGGLEVGIWGQPDLDRDGRLPVPRRVVGDHLGRDLLVRDDREAAVAGVHTGV